MKSIWAIWLSLCLIFFGVAVGLMAAVSTWVGVTGTLLAALFALTGGSLLALYKDLQLGTDGQEKVIHATGCMSLGVIIGLLSGFWLRHYDQTQWMPDTVRKWAELDRELREHKQQLADFRPKEVAGDSTRIAADPVVRPSIGLVASADTSLITEAKNLLNALASKPNTPADKKKTANAVLDVLELIESKTLTATDARQRLATQTNEFAKVFPDEGSVKTILDQIRGSIR